MTDLVELRPAPDVLLRHRDADLDIVTAPRTGPRVELRRGALWIRAGEDGPGVTVTHGASSVQVRAGAGVVEVQDVEALLVVAAGRAAVKGVSPLPRSVVAGQAVVLTLDGTFSDPDALSAVELAADRMVVENLALDNLASGVRATTAGDPPPPDPLAASGPTSADGPAAPEPVEADVAGAPTAGSTPDAGTAPGAADAPPPLPTRVPGATTEGRVDPPLAPRVRPDAEAPADTVPAPAAEATVAPAEPVRPAAPVGRPAPARPQAGPSALETALAGVGVTDTPLEPGEVRTPVAPPAPTTAATGGPDRGREPAGSDAATPGSEAPTGSTTLAAGDRDQRAKVRIVIFLIIGALLILAIVAAVVFRGDDSSAAPPVPVATVGTGSV